MVYLLLIHTFNDILKNYIFNKFSLKIYLINEIPKYKNEIFNIYVYSSVYCEVVINNKRL